MVPSLVGYGVIGSIVLLCAVLVPDEVIRRPLWLFIFLALAAGARFCWEHPKAPTSPFAWLRFLAGAVAVGLLFAAVDSAVFGVNSGHIVFDFCLASVGVVIAASGALRSLILGGQNDV